MLWRSPEFFTFLWALYWNSKSPFGVFCAHLYDLLDINEMVIFKTFKSFLFVPKGSVCHIFVTNFTRECFIQNTYLFKDKVQLGWMQEQYWFECIHKINVLNKTTEQILQHDIMWTVLMDAEYTNKFYNINNTRYMIGTLYNI